MGYEGFNGSVEPLIKTVKRDQKTAPGERAWQDPFGQPNQLPRDVWYHWFYFFGSKPSSPYFLIETSLHGHALEHKEVVRFNRSGGKLIESAPFAAFLKLILPQSSSATTGLTEEDRIK